MGEACIPRSLLSRPLTLREGGEPAPRPPLWIPAYAGMTDGGRGNDGIGCGNDGWVL